MYTKATVFVPPSLVAQVRVLAAQVMAVDGQVIDTMWPHPVSASGSGPAEMWMHTGWFGNQFFSCFVDPEVLAAKSGMTVEQAAGMLSVCRVVEADWDAALAEVELQMIPKVNVNEATQAALESVSGIGATKAKAIIAGRPWATVADLTAVAGIGPDQIAELERWYTA